MIDGQRPSGAAAIGAIVARADRRAAPGRTPSSASCARRWRRPLDPAGVYFGTSTGQLFGSADEGEHWPLIADYLPPIWSVEAAVSTD